jgi:FkbM family methyltransferase
MSKVCSGLIYDVGLLNGEDTAYYLFRGYNVVSIDANPLMIEKAKLRFSKEILSKRLILLNVGIAGVPGTAPFWISDVPEWSSFNKSIASRYGTAYRSVLVSTLPFTQLLAEYGVPHYLKIDIEGNDKICVDALQGGIIPKYISVESECVDDSTVLSDEGALSILESLRNVGYRRFKLVDQSTWFPARSGSSRFLMRLVNSAAHGRLRIRGLSRIAERFSDGARIAKMGFTFSQGSSGPWGDDIPGSWMTFNKARSVYLRMRRSFFLKNKCLCAFWHDWHATD